jgi:cytidylate kinase
MRPVVVALDGPESRHKSVVARLVAAKLGFTYIDAGAMYRAVALWALRERVDLNDHHKMEQLAAAAEIALQPAGPGVRLNHDDVTDAISAPEVAAAASRLALIPGVRRALVDKQRALAAMTSVVMEGRDIGAVVFPSADVKIFLDAGERGRTRVEAPITQAPDAVYLDVQGLSVEEMEERVLRIVRERITNGKDFS